jgi:hypothetical protein
MTSYQNLETDSLIERPPKEEPVSNHRYVLVALVAMTMVAALGVASFSRSGGSMRKSMFTSSGPYPGEWAVNRYTASVGAGYGQEVADFMNTYITDSNHFQAVGCGDLTKRSLSYVAGNPTELHFVDSSIFPQEGKSVEDVWKHISGLGVDEFHAFMYNKVQLFVSDLSAHYDKIVMSGDEDLPPAVLRLSRSDGSEEYDVAHINMQAPYTGNFYELVGPSSSLPAEELEKFQPYAEEECEAASTLLKPLPTLQAMYDEWDMSAFDTWMSSSGLPVPMIVGVVVPVSSTNFAAGTLSMYADMGIDISTLETDTCTVKTVKMGEGETDDTAAFTTPIKYVVNTKVHQGGEYTLQDWEADIALSHTELLSDDYSTWDRYLDSHIGIYNYNNGESTDFDSCGQYIKSLNDGSAAYGFKGSNREDSDSTHLYVGVNAIMSTQITYSCSGTGYSDYCGCTAENNDGIYFLETGDQCSA